MIILNIFEEGRKKYEIKSKGDAVMLGLSILLAGGVLFLIGLPLSFFIIGIPFVIGGFIAMVIGLLMILAAPFWNPNKKAKPLSEAWAQSKERDKKILAKVMQFFRK